MTAPPLRLAPRPALLALLCVAAAGCAGAPPDPQDAVQEDGTGGPGALHLNGCTGFQASTWTMPAALSPARPPEGWEGEPASELLLLFVDCERLSLGPFERPAKALFELHTGALVPEACSEASATRTLELVLHAAWLDDPEVAAYLAATAGLPASAAAFGSEAADAGGVRIHTWTWAPPGQAASELRVAEGPDRLPDPWGARLYWARGGPGGPGGIGSLSLDFERTRASVGPAQSTLQGVGAMKDPMLMAGLPGGLFEGPVQTFPALAADGTFLAFADAMCRDPEPAP